MKTLNTGASKQVFSNKISQNGKLWLLLATNSIVSYQEIRVTEKGLPQLTSRSVEEFELPQYCRESNICKMF